MKQINRYGKQKWVLLLHRFALFEFGRLCTINYNLYNIVQQIIQRIVWVWPSLYNNWQSQTWENFWASLPPILIANIIIKLYMLSDLIPLAVLNNCENYTKQCFGQAKTIWIANMIQYFIHHIFLLSSNLLKGWNKCFETFGDNCFRWTICYWGQ